MLKLIVLGDETWNRETQTFDITPSVELQLEHSLVSLSKWESQHEKPFLRREQKTAEEVYSYMQAMSLQGDIPQEVLNRLSEQNLVDFNEYLNAKQTATWFNEPAMKAQNRNSSEITAEIIYHWMVALDINWEAQYWHLNRLITLVKTINEKNKEASDTKRKSLTSDQLADRRSVMEKRRAEEEARRKGGSQT